MQSKIVLSALGLDKSGIVDQVSRLVSAHNLNIEKSRMSVMGTEFSLVTLLSGDKTDIEHFLEKIDDTLGALDLDYVVRPTDNASARNVGPALPYMLSIASIDAVGLVSRISSVIGKFEANIEDMDTAVGHAPESGTLIFHMNCLVLVPQRVRIDEIRSALYALADDLNCDLSFDPA